MTGQLLIQIEPYEGESLRGFLLRLAEANFLESSAWIGDAPTEVRRIKKLVGSVLHGRIPNWLRTPDMAKTSPPAIAERFILGSRARCCPACLAEHRFWRVEWEHALYTVCHRHGYLLVDECPQCLKKLTWKRQHLSSCACGSSIFTWPTLKASYFEWHLCIRLASCIATDCGHPSTETENAFEILVGEIDTTELATFIVIFGYYGEMLDDAPKPGGCQIVDIKAAHHMISVAARMLYQWPNSFYLLLKEVGGYKAPSAIQHEPKPYFLAFTKALRKNFHTSSLTFVMNDYRKFMTKNWRGVLNHRNTWASEEAFNSQRFVPAGVVARHLRIRRKLVKDLVSRNILRGTIKITPGGREFVVVERDSIANAESYFGDQVTISGAAILLGLPRGRIEELVSAGFLTSLVDPGRRQKTRLLSRKEIERFLRRLTGGCREPSEGEDLLRFPIILKTHLASEKEFVALISALLAREIAMVASSSTKQGFGGFSLNREEFYVWRAADRKNHEDTQLTVVEVARRLRIKQEVAYHLVRTGRLPSKVGILGRQRCQFVSLVGLQKFNASYISTKNITWLDTRSPKAMVSGLRARGIIPVMGPDIDGCRQYFFRRADLSFKKSDPSSVPS